MDEKIIEIVIFSDVVAAAQRQVNNDVKIYVSILNSNNNTFTLRGAASVGEFKIDNLYALPGQVLIDNLSSFELVDLSPTLNETVIDKSIQKTDDFFQDKTGAVYLMISSFDVYYANPITKLPGTTAITVDGSAAGLCRYTLKDQIDSHTFTTCNWRT